MVQDYYGANLIKVLFYFPTVAIVVTAILGSFIWLVIEIVERVSFAVEKYRALKRIKMMSKEKDIGGEKGEKYKTGCSHSEL